MPGRKDNALRKHHLLVVRVAEGFIWQIRYGRQAGTIEQSGRTFMTLPEAEAAGTEAVQRYRAAAARPTDSGVIQR